MQGHWIGFLDGSTPGHVVLDLDELADRFVGTALFIPSDQSLPSTAAFIDTADKSDQVSITAPIFVVDEQDRSIISPVEYMVNHPDLIHASTADIEIFKSNDGLVVSYKTSVGSEEISQANGLLYGSYCGDKSTYNPSEQITWNQFKSKVSGFSPEEYVWRGQPEPWALQTSFHRTGRVNLHRYTTEDVARLRSALLPHTTTFLHLDSALVTGGLYSLAQHHGFPTPLLDWTYSPYVAAFFALHSLPKSPDRKDSVARVFAFHRSAWPQDSNAITHLALARPHVTFQDLVPLENERALPQQALAMVSTAPNIEALIRFQEGQDSRTYLTPFDLPWSERDAAMRDLRTMGITSATMFPGIDGTCKELRDRYFD